MAITPDSGIKKTIVPTTMLPKITKDGKYIVRYRIVSEDLANTSTWSPHYFVSTTPISSNSSGDITILNPTPTALIAPKYEVTLETKSHGASFDVSWKITNKETDLIDIPAPLVGLSYDSYVRWGTKISEVPTTNIDGKILITTELPPNVPKNEYVIIEHIGGSKTSYRVISDDIAANPFTIDATSTTYTVGDYVWTPWEYIATTSTNSFSVPIPPSHKSQIVIKGYAEFMVHVSTTAKDVDESSYQTLLLYSDHITTQGVYDSTSLS